MQVIPCHYACQGAQLAYLILCAPHGPATPNREGESIPRGPRGGEVGPRHRLVTLPTQDFNLFDRLPPRMRPRAIVINLPGAPVAPAPPVLPDVVLRAAVLLMMRSPPTLAPGAGPHPGILHRFINGHHGFPPGYVITNPYDQVLPGRLSSRRATAVPPLAQATAPEVGRTYPSVCATFGRCGVARSRLRFGALTYPMPSPKRYPSCPQSGTGRVDWTKALEDPVLIRLPYGDHVTAEFIPPLPIRRGVKRPRRRANGTFNRLAISFALHSCHSAFQ
jgi:hypothetical protein